jgi:zinc protease
MPASWFRSFALALFLIAFAARPAAAQVFDPTVFTLKNGMTVVVVENHRAPIVSHMVWYKVGAADEPAGKTGLAHLLEHLMFKGTPQVPAGLFSRLIAEKGGVDNAMTSRDFTAYYQHIAAEHLPLAMRLEADRMAHLKLAEKDFRSEREVVREERRQRVDNEPGAMLSERLAMALWMNHPYARPVGGFDAEIRGLTRADALAFHKRWYAPGNAILFVAGDVTPAWVRELAEATFGRIPGKPLPPRVRPPLEAPPADIRIALAAPTVRQTEWRRVVVAPSCGTADGKTVAAFEVLAEILGGGTTSRLYRSLVLERKLAVDVEADHSGMALGPGTFSVAATPMPGHTPEELDRAVGAEIARIADAGVAADELARVKDRLLAERVFARDDLFAAPQALAQALAVGCTLAAVEDFARDVAALSPADIEKAARTVAGPAAQAVLTPAEAAK